MKWFDNMIVRALDRVAARSKTEGVTQPSRQYLHNSHLSDILNGRVCSMVFSIDNGFILVNQDPNRHHAQYIYAKDAVEVGETVARQLTLQRMGVVQGASIRGASTSGPYSMTVGPGQAEISVSPNPSF